MFDSIRFFVGKTLLRAAFAVLGTEAPPEPEPEKDEEPDFDIAPLMALDHVLTPTAKEMIEKGLQKPTRKRQETPMPLKGSLQEKYMRERGLIR